MNPLILSGYDIEIRAGRTKLDRDLKITDGQVIGRLPERYLFPPRQCPYDSIVIENGAGLVTLQAMRWLAEHGIPLFLLDFDGETIGSFMPPMAVKADLRVAQIQAAYDSRKKLRIAKAILEAKFQRSIQILEWLRESHDIEHELRAAKAEASKLPETRNVGQARTVEGRTAVQYWEAIKKILPPEVNFKGRVTGTHNSGAVDPFNASLNYSYGFLKVVCRMAINSVGLEPAVGFLHEISRYQTAESLVYDLEEPFRFLSDFCVIEAFESQAFRLSDFGFIPHGFRYMIQPNSKALLRERLIELFNSGVSYQGKTLKWDTVIGEKALELSRYLTGRASEIDFSEPVPSFERTDTDELRKSILRLTQKDASLAGIGKSELHYLREKARSPKPFNLYTKIKAKLEKLPYRYSPHRGRGPERKMLTLLDAARYERLNAERKGESAANVEGFERVAEGISGKKNSSKKKRLGKSQA
jgi:CRISPR-associated protein Cas1